MKFSKYILCYACICAFETTAGFAAFSGDDPIIAELKEADARLKSGIDSQKTDTEEIKTLVEELKTQLQKTSEDLKAGLTSVNTEMQSSKEKLAALEERTSASSESEQESKIAQEISDIKTELKNISEMKQSDEELTLLKGLVSDLNDRLKNKDEVDEKQNIEAAQYAARLDKLERQSGSSGQVGSSLTGLFGNALQGGIGLLSQSLDLKK